jgi:hypothetical protein
MKGTGRAGWICRMMQGIRSLSERRLPIKASPHAIELHLSWQLRQPMASHCIQIEPNEINALQKPETVRRTHDGLD